MIRHTDDLVSAPLPAPEVLGTRSGASTASPQAPAPVRAAPVEPTREEVQRAVSQANSQMTAVAPSLQFEIDPDTRAVVIRLVDRADQRVLRQVPSTEMLAISRALARMQTLLLRINA